MAHYGEKSMQQIAEKTVTVIDPRGLRVKVQAGSRVPAHLVEGYGRAAADRPAERSASKKRKQGDADAKAE